MASILPSPTGPYPVSFTDVMDKPGINGTFFRIYYPTKNFNPKTVTFPMWMEPEYSQVISAFIGGIKPFPVAVPINLPLSLPNGIEKLPVLVFSHGLLLSKNANSFLCSDIASYGFIVAAVDHKDGSASASFYLEETDEGYVKKTVNFQHIPFGSEEEKIKRTEQVEVRVKELSKVLDWLEGLNEGNATNIYSSDLDLTQFKGKLQLNQSAVVGYSHGGAASLAALAREERFKIGIALDPWMLVFDEKYLKEKIDKPIIFINLIGELKKSDILKIRQLDGDITGTDAERSMVTILGTTHLTQSDFAFFPESVLKSINFVAKNDAKLSNAINTKLMLTFIRKHFSIPGNQKIETVIADYSGYVQRGTNIEVSNAEILEAKNRIKSSITN